MYKFKKNIEYAGKIYNVGCFDGLILFIDNQHTIKDVTIYEGRNFINIVDSEIILSDVIYVASNGKFNAHGETISKAKEDLIFKINQDKLSNEPITLDTIITINHYRAITGACEYGVKEFMANHNLIEPMMVKDLLPILEQTNAYGLNKFKNLISK